MKNLLILLIFLISNVALSAETRTLGRSPRGLLMGNAYTSLAVDEYSLFYNPALLARHKAFSFTPLNATISAVNVLKDQDRFTDIGDDPSDFSDAALGFPVHLGLNLSPGFKMGRFGMSAIMDTQTNFNLQNKVNPTLEIDHRSDKGFIIGYGHPIMGSYTTGGTGTQLAAGVSAKFINRESLDGSYYLLGTGLLDALSAGEMSEVLNALGKVNGQGWGFDAGLDYVNATGSGTFAAGLSFLDILTNFQTEDNVQDLEVQDQPMQVNLGTSYLQKIGAGFDFTLSADIQNLSQEMELAQRLSFGLELGLSPALSLLAGVNAVDNYSYGLMFDIGIARFYLGFYGVETGEKVQQEESNRILIYISLFNFTFDP
jgi:hypothetical protein